MNRRAGRPILSVDNLLAGVLISLVTSIAATPFALALLGRDLPEDPLPPIGRFLVVSGPTIVAAIAAVVLHRTNKKRAALGATVGAAVTTLVWVAWLSGFPLPFPVKDGNPNPEHVHEFRATLSSQASASDVIALLSEATEGRGGLRDVELFGEERRLVLRFLDVGPDSAACAILDARRNHPDLFAETEYTFNPASCVR